MVVGGEDRSCHSKGSIDEISNERTSRLTKEKKHVLNNNRRKFSENKDYSHDIWAKRISCMYENLTTKQGEMLSSDKYILIILQTLNRFIFWLFFTYITLVNVVILFVLPYCIKKPLNFDDLNS